MAIIPYQIVSLPQNDAVGATGIVYWPDMANGDIGQAFELFKYTDRTVQVFGTFGAGGTVAVAGSLDGTNYATLADPNGNALSITTAKLETVLEATRYIRPSASGDGTTSLTVYLQYRG
jgi:hypothetical protein